MIEEIQDDASTRMDKSCDALSEAFARIRTGRANPALLDTVTLAYYGAPTPIKQLASITVEEGRTLVVSPWEKALINDIEKAILASNIGLTPNNNGEVIRLPLPPLTEENRKELVKQARSEAENARIAIRNIRRDAIADVRELVKEKLVTEDEGHHAEVAVQAITDDKINNVEALLEEKVKD
ncbi:MAG: ribosome recycling factor, partial [Gammaproteobacteria bacterium]|nr:ribosome recycling factor [Gammaproteobacteria bacterium]